jgi:hypothetical protein
LGRFLLDRWGIGGHHRGLCELIERGCGVNSYPARGQFLVQSDSPDRFGDDRHVERHLR